MEMSLMHAGLAAGGAALAALPVILHLFMRQTPKHVIFPALRLIRERQKQSKKRMRIKNWLLLLARMAVIAFMALALGRPSLYSQVPLGVGIAADGAGAGLRHQPVDGLHRKGQDAARRGEGACARDRDQAAGLEPGLRGRLGRPARSGRAGRRRRRSSASSRSTIRPVNRPLNSAMGQVYPAVAECDRPLRVVYVLTDLCRTSWQPGAIG